MLQLKFLFKNCSGLKYGLTDLYCVTTADFFQGGEKKSICLEVSHMTSSQISVSKASHVATLNFKVMECKSTMYPEETEEQPQQPANHEGTSHHTRCSLSHQWLSSCCYYYHDYRGLSEKLILWTLRPKAEGICRCGNHLSNTLLAIKQRWIYKHLQDIMEGHAKKFLVSKE